MSHSKLYLVIRHDYSNTFQASAILHGPFSHHMNAVLQSPLGTLQALGFPETPSSLSHPADYAFFLRETLSLALTEISSAESVL